LPGPKTLSYWAHFEVMKKMNCCEYGPRLKLVNHARTYVASGSSAEFDKDISTWMFHFENSLSVARNQWLILLSKI